MTEIQESMFPAVAPSVPVPRYVTVREHRRRIAVPSGDPGVGAKEPTARRAGHDTEKTAAKKAGKVSGRQRLIVLDSLWLHGAGQGTDYEISVWTGIPRHVAAKRRGELVELGYVKKTGDRRVTDTGSPAIVWMLTTAGLAWCVANRKEGV